ncbi:MAG: Spy/CpxP family protein refolding chaperone [Byssovorax sp.]
MLGIIIGTVCLIGLVKVLRRGRYGRHGYGGGCGTGGGGGCGGGWGGGGRFRGHHGHEGGWGGHEGGFRRGGWGGGWGGPGFILRAIVEQLDATPEQEKVIVAAFREVREEAAKHRGEARKSREDIAKAMRSPGFDEVLLGELFARHDTAIEAMRRAATGALAKVHVVLDEKQRGELADLIENGPGFFRRGPSRRRGFDPSYDV